MPGPGVNQSVNIQNNQLKSLDYSEGGQSKVSINGSRRASGRGQGRGVSAVSRSSKRKLQTVDHDADMVNFTNGNIQITDPTLQHVMLPHGMNPDSSGDINPMPPSQNFHGKKLAGLKS